MPDNITLTVLKEDGTTRPFTIQTENKEFINSIIEVGENNTISEQDAKILLDTLSNDGDMGVLENIDLNPKQKQNLAQIFNFDKYYDIQLSKDGKYFKVTIKDAGFFVKNPTLGDIKSDFGIRDNVFVTENEIPHGNSELINNNPKGMTADDRNIDYDKTTIFVGQTINIPVDEINITGTPRGMFGRLLK